MENNDTFTDEYGVLYSADGKRLIKVPDTLTCYSVRNGTEIIERKAFNNHWHLKAIAFPNTLTTIGKRAFEGCWGIDTPIILPDSVTELEPYCFSFCSYAPSITFGRNLKKRQCGAHHLLQASARDHYPRRESTPALCGRSAVQQRDDGIDLLSQKPEKKGLYHSRQCGGHP